MRYADLLFPAIVRNGVNLYINAFGEHVIPKEIIAQAIKVNGPTKSIFDERTLGYRVIRHWANQVDAESKAQWIKND